MYEPHHHRLLSLQAFLWRVAAHLFAGLVIVATAVGVGTFGYHLAGGLPWVDSFLNASMILSGMGPVDHLNTEVGKIFSALYALFSGLIFIVIAGIIAAPWVHRLFHWMHIEDARN